MISNSWVWKRELQKELKAFKKFLENLPDESVNSDYIYFKLQKFFFVIAFIIRKLNEANLLSDELTSKKIPIEKLRRIDKERPIDFIFRGVEFYDFENAVQGSMAVLALCNCFIHSFEFQPVYDETEERSKTAIAGVVVNSDRTKDTVLYYVGLEVFFEFVREVINDHVKSLSFNRETGEIKKSRA